MKMLRVMVPWLLALLVPMGAVAASPAPSMDGCTREHSRALCIAKAAAVAGAMTDSKPGEAAEHVRNGGSYVAWYATTVLAYGTKAWAPPKGFSTGSSIAMILMGAVSEKSEQVTPMMGNNIVFGFMPVEMATSSADAITKARAILVAATLESFPGSTLEEIPGETAPELKQYRISGGACDGHDCILAPVRMMGRFGPAWPAQAARMEVPDFLGGGIVWRIGNTTGSLRPLNLVVDGKVQTHRYLQELSKHLPPWMYVGVSPEMKRRDGSIMNEGIPVPVTFSQGKPMLFVFPEDEGDDKVAVAN